MALPEVFKVLSDSKRREVLQSLKDGKMTAGDIAEHFSMSPAAISYHLKLLKKADLVKESKYKNYIYYELNISIFEELIMWLCELKGGAIDEK